jgi:hypothetical protein
MWQFNPAWFWLIPIPFVFPLILLILLKGRRLAFLSLLSGICILLFTIMALRNWHTDEGGELQLWITSPQGLDTYGVGITFQRFTVAGSIDRSHTGPDDAIPTTATKSGRISWTRSLSSAPLKAYRPDIDLGFIANKLSIMGSDPNLWRSTTTYYMPLWSLALLCAIAPSFWLYSKYKRLRTARAVPSPCPQCGYSLLAHAPGQRCPECSTAIEHRKSKIKN